GHPTADYRDSTVHYGRQPGIIAAETGSTTIAHRVSPQTCPHRGMPRLTGKTWCERPDGTRAKRVGHRDKCPTRFARVLFSAHRRIHSYLLSQLRHPCCRQCKSAFVAASDRIPLMRNKPISVLQRFATGLCIAVVLTTASLYAQDAGQVLALSVS